MKCDEARQRWHDRLDAGQPDAALDQHLSACPACSRYARQVQSIVNELDELRIATDGVVSNRTESIAPVCPRRRVALLPIAGGRGWAIAAAIAMALVGTGYFVLSRPGTRGPGGHVALVQDTTGADSSGWGNESRQVGLTLRGESARQLLAVVSPTDNPRVQVYWLYPSVYGTSSEDQAEDENSSLPPGADRAG